MSNKIILKKSSVVAKVPTTADLDYGELALNYADNRLYYKTASNTISYFGAGAINIVANLDMATYRITNLGDPVNAQDAVTKAWILANTSVVNGTYNRWLYTATAAQTQFAAVHSIGYIDVYLNGFKLVTGIDYTDVNALYITLTEGAAVGDILDIIAFGSFILADTYTKTQIDVLLSSLTNIAQEYVYTATSGQTVFAANYAGGWVTVYLNGSKLLPTTDFTFATGSNITLTSGAVTGDEINIIATTVSAVNPDSLLPQQTSNSGKYLTTNGSTPSWSTVDALPTQTSNSGKYLTTNGSIATWATLITPAKASGAILVNTTTVSENYTIPTGSNAHSVGPIKIATGYAVTVSAGQSWNVV